MSFFCDVFQDFDVMSCDKKVKAVVVFGERVFVVGNVKVDMLSADKIILKNKQMSVVVWGENLFVETMSKGEFLIKGNVKQVGCEDDKND